MTEFVEKWKQIKAGIATLTIRWVVYAAPVISLIAWMLIHWVSILCGFSVMDLSEEILIGTKITFLSIIIALGMFQYGYFYSESKELEHRLQRGDYGPEWAEYVQQAKRSRDFIAQEEIQLEKSRQLLDRAQHMASQTPPVLLANDVLRLEAAVNARVQGLDRLHQNQQAMDNAIQRARAEFEPAMRREVLDLTVRVTLLFAIGILVYVSLILDLIPLILPGRFALPFSAYSQSAFLGSLAVFGLMLVLFLGVVQIQARYYGKV